VLPAPLRVLVALVGPRPVLGLDGLPLAVLLVALAAQDLRPLDGLKGHLVVRAARAALDAELGLLWAASPKRARRSIEIPTPFGARAAILVVKTIHRSISKA
jgi:hypothetical protein